MSSRLISTFLAGSYLRAFSSSSFLIRTPFLHIWFLLLVLEKVFLSCIFSKLFLWTKMLPGTFWLVGFHGLKVFSDVLVMVSSNSNGIYTDSTQISSPWLAPLSPSLLALFVGFGTGNSDTIFSEIFATTLSFKALFKHSIKMHFAPHTGSPRALRCFFKLCTWFFGANFIAIVVEGDNVLHSSFACACSSTVAVSSALLSSLRSLSHS